MGSLAPSRAFRPRPTIALVNNAQREHLEFMATVEAVARENGSVFEALPADGTAVFPHDGNSHEVLMAKADRRMYRNKVMHKRDAQARAAAAQQAVPGNRAAS